MITKLARKQLDTKSLQSVTEPIFVREAKQLLGYAVLEQALALRKAAEVMDTLGIQPFSDASVLKYKEERAAALVSRTQKTNRYGDRIETRTRGEWESSNLRGYKREVPAFALLRAAELKKALTKAKVDSNFEVDELRLHTTKRNRGSRPIIDPFMVLVVGGERLYIDVWDEPKFEGRRTK